MINGSTGYLYLFASETVAREKLIKRNPVYRIIEKRTILFGFNLLSEIKPIYITEARKAKTEKLNTTAL